MTSKTDDLYEMLMDALVNGTSIRSWDEIFRGQGMMTLSQTARIVAPGIEPDPVDTGDWDSLDWTEAR